MNKQQFKVNSLWVYLFKFIGVFCLCYFGTLAVIGVAAPGHFYFPFVAHYLDYIDWLRSSLLLSAKFLLSLLGYDTWYFANQDILQVKNGYGIRMVYSCIGYGIMSFWVAFVYANTVNLRKKLKWIVGGLFLIWLMNVIRIVLLMIAVNKHWLGLLPMEHHTVFNIGAYIVIAIMVYYFHRSDRNNLHARK